MDIESGHGHSKTDTFFTAGFSILNTIVIKDTIVDPLNGRSGFHQFFPSNAASWDSGKQVQIPIWFGIDNSAVGGGGAILTGATKLTLAADARAAPL